MKTQSLELVSISLGADATMEEKGRGRKREKVINFLVYKREKTVIEGRKNSRIFKSTSGKSSKLDVSSMLLTSTAIAAGLSLYSS